MQTQVLAFINNHIVGSIQSYRLKQLTVPPVVLTITAPTPQDIAAQVAQANQSAPAGG